jgi:hypothetical protein
MNTQICFFENLLVCDFIFIKIHVQFTLIQLIKTTKIRSKVNII